MGLAVQAAAAPATAAARPIRVVVAMDTLATSNIARASREVARSRGIEPADVRLSPRAQLIASLPLSRQRLFLDTQLGYDFHRRNSQLDSSRGSLLGGADLALARCEATLSGLFARNQTELDELVDTADARNVVTTRRASLELGCGDSFGLRPTLALSRDWTSNGSALRRFGDSRAGRQQIGLAYARPTFGTLSLTASFEQVDYPNRPLLAGAGADGYDVRSIGGSFERRIGARLKGRTELSYTQAKSNGRAERFSGLTFGNELSLSLEPRLNARLSLKRAVEPARLGAGDFVITTNGGFDIDYALGRRLTIGGLFSRETRSTRGEGLAANVLVSDKRNVVGTRLQYRLNERISAALRLDREQRRARPAIFDFVANNATLNLIFTL